MITLIGATVSFFLLSVGIYYLWAGMPSRSEIGRPLERRPRVRDCMDARRGFSIPRRNYIWQQVDWQWQDRLQEQNELNHIRRDLWESRSPFIQRAMRAV